MHLLYVLLVILIATRVCGELAVRWKQPPLVGELVSGVILGLAATHLSDALPGMQGLPNEPAFVAIVNLAIFFLMLYAGLEIKPEQLLEGAGRPLRVAIGGMVVPFALGCALAAYVLPASEYRHAQILFLGTALAVTAVPVSVKVLMDLGELHSRVGRTIVAAAIADDVISLVLLAALTAIARSGALPEGGALLLLLGKIALFFATTIAVGRWVIPRLAPRLERLRSEELAFSAVVVVGLAFAVLAEQLEMHFMLGGFAAGLCFNARTLPRGVFDDVKGKVGTLTKGFLAPIFFASIGMHLDTGALTAVPVFLAVLIVVAIAGKLVGAGLPALWAGMDRREALAVGVGMSGRGAVELVVADVALRAGLFEHPDPPPPIVAHLFSSIVVMALVTTLFTPIVLRAVVPRRAPPGIVTPAVGRRRGRRA